MSLAPTSPRLPSPPPAAEIQMTPSSPSGGPAATLETSQMEQTLLDASSRRRIHPGTKATDMAAGPPLIPLHELDSAFQLQEHLAALHFYHTASNTQPLTRATAIQLAQPPSGIDRTIWLYELCRFLISQCNSLIVGFLFDTPPCSASTCPEMRASEWQFLCAVHEQPKSCCAIDYCCHTLDWAANVVTDQKIFPSRFVVMSDNHSKNVGVKNLVNVFRRLHRIFAHAWFQHRGVFWSVEGQTGLYVFFKSVCDLYDLLPAENYKLPPEAEGLEQPSIEQEAEKPIPQILKPPTQQRAPHSGEDSLHPTRTNTRRHIRSSPSTGSAVTTVMEAEAEAEEEEEEGADGVARKMREMHIAPPATAEDESSHAEISVVVEPSIVADSKPQEPESSTQEKEEDGDSDEESDADQTIVDIDSGQEPKKQKEEDEKVEDSAPAKEPAASTTETKKDADSKDERTAKKSSDTESKEDSEPKNKDKNSSESQFKETESKKLDGKAPALESSKEAEPKGKDA